MAAPIYLILLQGGRYGHLYGPLGGRVIGGGVDGVVEPSMSRPDEPINALRGIVTASLQTGAILPNSATGANLSPSYSGEIVAAGTAGNIT